VDDNRLFATPNTSPAEDLQDLVIKQIVLVIAENVCAIKSKQGLLEGFHFSQRSPTVCITGDALNMQHHFARQGSS